MNRMVWPRPGKAVIALLAINVVAYVIELLVIRGGGGEIIRVLGLSPRAVFEQGWVWQVGSYMLLHDPSAPMHLLFNMLWLWMFGSPLEGLWGPRRLVTAYLICGLGGAILTLLIGLLSTVGAFSPLLRGFWATPHLGASGAVMGLTIAWGIAYANQRMNFLFLGEMYGRTFVLIIVAVELLVALSLAPTSSSAHFGGMAAAFILCKGLWRPSRWKDLARKSKLKSQRKKIEHELRIIQGGKDEPPDDPSRWN